MRATVIIPSYNYGVYIREALESVFAQTVAVDQIIVVDDGSTDHTPDVLARIRHPRLQVIRTPNRGVSEARNRGLDAACGDVVCFLDADDRWHPEKWAREQALLAAEPEVGAIFSNFVRFKDDHIFPQDQFQFFPELRSVPARLAQSGHGHVIEGDAFPRLLAFTEFPTWGGTATFRSNVVRGLRFAPELPICEDMHFCLRAYRLAAVAYFVEPLVEVRRHVANATAETSRVGAFKLKALQMLESEPLTPGQRSALRRRIGRQLIDVGTRYARNGNLSQALRSFGLAPRYDPIRTFSAAKHVIALPFHLARRK